MSDIKRQTAHKCSLDQINNSKYIKTTGWDPNYLQMGQLEVSRVNIICVIISITGNTVVVEDNTDKIELKVFDNLEQLNKIKPGDLVLIIGRPREYNGSMYLLPEIIKKLDDPKWIDYRKLELELIEIKPIQVQPVQITEQEQVKINPTDILDIIKELDSGEGVGYEQLIEKINHEEAEKLIQNLINEGEIFEIRPGKLKILELS